MRWFGWRLEAGAFRWWVPTPVKENQKTSENWLKIVFVDAHRPAFYKVPKWVKRFSESPIQKLGTLPCKYGNDSCSNRFTHLFRQGFAFAIRIRQIDRQTPPTPANGWPVVGTQVRLYFSGIEAPSYQCSFCSVLVQVFASLKNKWQRWLGGNDTVDCLIRFSTAVRTL